VSAREALPLASERPNKVSAREALPLASERPNKVSAREALPLASERLSKVSAYLVIQILRFALLNVRLELTRKRTVKQFKLHIERYAQFEPSKISKNKGWLPWKNEGKSTAAVTLFEGTHGESGCFWFKPIGGYLAKTTGTFPE